MTACGTPSVPFTHYNCLDPKRQQNMIRSYPACIAERIHAFIPFRRRRPRAVMIGHHAAQLIVDTYSKDIATSMWRSVCRYAQDTLRKATLSRGVVRPDQSDQSLR